MFLVLIGLILLFIKFSCYHVCNKVCIVILGSDFTEKVSINFKRLNCFNCYDLLFKINCFCYGFKVRVLKQRSFFRELKQEFEKVKKN